MTSHIVATWLDETEQTLPEQFYYEMKADMSDSAIGLAYRSLFKPDTDVASSDTTPTNVQGFGKCAILKKLFMSSGEFHRALAYTIIL